MHFDNCSGENTNGLKNTASGESKVPMLFSSALLFAAGAYLGFGEQISDATLFKSALAGVCALGATSSLAYCFYTHRQNSKTDEVVIEQVLPLSKELQTGGAELTKAELFSDALTGIGNKFRLEEKFKNVASNISDQKFAIGAVNLDGMRNINELYGTAGGDHLLKQCAMRMRAAVDEFGFVFRQKADQFAFILPNIEDQREVFRIGKLIQDVLTAPFDIEGSAVRITGSFGFAIYPDSGDGFEAIFESIEAALSFSKRKGRNGVTLYNSEIEAKIRESAELEQALRRAIALKQVQPHFQPIISLQDGKLLGFESLARWNDSELGNVSTEKFIALAEERGFIGQLTEMLLLQASKTAADWPEDLFLSFNLSSAQLVDPSAAEMILRSIEKGGLAPHRLEIEVTETAIISDPYTATKIIEELSDAGVRISMDDFGTGQSSLGRLRELKLDKVKIDRAFISAIGEDKPAEHIVKAILEMCVGLELTVVAEGIEDITQAATLKNFGCHAAQGFLFGKAQDATKTMGYIKEFRKPANDDREVRIA